MMWELQFLLRISFHFREARPLAEMRQETLPPNLHIRLAGVVRLSVSLDQFVFNRLPAKVYERFEDRKRYGEFSGYYVCFVE